MYWAYTVERLQTKLQLKIIPAFHSAGHLDSWSWTPLTQCHAFCDNETSLFGTTYSWLTFHMEALNFILSVVKSYICSHAFANIPPSLRPCLVLSAWQSGTTLANTTIHFLILSRLRHSTSLWIARHFSSLGFAPRLLWSCNLIVARIRERLAGIFVLRLETISWPGCDIIT